jgi:DNA replication and repair protein RecF
VYIRRLQLTDFRNLADATLAPGDGINWLSGANGAGKTSVLEAIHVLATGRSFRAGRIAPMVRDGADRFRVVCRTAAPEHRLGVERSASGWVGRIDGEPTQRLSAFARAVPVVTVHPENHQLLEGGPDNRRSFLDWGLFHVEQSYLDEWKRYNRLLRQRNAALRRQPSVQVLASLEEPMAEAAARLDRHRAAYVERLTGSVDALASALSFGIPELDLAYRPSCESSADYRAQWASARERDIEQGYTREGPHRAELAIRAHGRLAAPRLSRGQMKLAALLLRLAQMRVAENAQHTPMLLLDDPVSELDRQHLDRLLEWLEAQRNQSWVTAVDPPGDRAATLFHVEQGRIRQMV